MTFDEFITKWTGQTVDTDGVYPNQCMDLMHAYVRDVLSLPVNDLSAPAAYEVYTTFPNVTGASNFTQIPNTPSFIPIKGDILFFGQTIGEYGHVCIFHDGDANTFNSFDANWPLGSLPHIQKHNYNGVLGVLRLKGVTPVNMYKGLDLDNNDSMKVCVDVWADLQAGNLVQKSQYDLVNSQLATTTANLARANASIGELNDKIAALQAQPSTPPGTVQPTVPPTENPTPTTNNPVPAGVLLTDATKMQLFNRWCFLVFVNPGAKK